MKQDVTYRVEACDHRAICPERVLELKHLLANYIRDDEDPRSVDGRGLKAVGRIRGNAFTAEDVAAMEVWAAALLERKAAAIEAVRAERDRIAAGDFERNAYDGLVATMEQGGREVRRIVEGYREAFNDARSMPSEAL